jgi:hypothetical protein
VGRANERSTELQIETEPTGARAVAPQETESKTEQLSRELAELRAEQAADRRAFSTWAVSVGATHLLIALGFWIGMAKSDFKGNEMLFLILAVPSIVLLTTGMSVLMSLAAARLRRSRLQPTPA